jgi:hypothetical protein
MTDQATKHIRSSELKVGDMLKLWCGNHRVTAFEPYRGPLDCITKIVCVEGKGAFISDDGTGWEIYV